MTDSQRTRLQQCRAALAYKIYVTNLGSISHAYDIMGDIDAMLSGRKGIISDYDDLLRMADDYICTAKPYMGHRC